ncbi:MAG: mandelate racemase/muconate lactonizing enzyme family protein [Pirellulales bacterium]
MSKATDITLKEISTCTRSYAYRQPIKFGGRVVDSVTVLRCEITVTSGQGKKKTVGIGEMTMGNAWAWPSKIPAPLTLKILIDLAERIVEHARTLNLSGDPLQITHRLAHERKALVAEFEKERNLQEPIPKLAVMLAASPLEAAIHDAFGRSLDRNSFDCMTSEFLNQDLGAYLGEEFIGQYPDKVLSAKPKPTMPLYHLVGALDPLTDDDVRQKLNDGFPQTLEQWLSTDGLTHLKIKLAGNDLDWDVGRIVEVNRVAELIAQDRKWRYSLDFNEQCPNEDYVLDLIERVERLSRPALDRVQYIEQPTPRDLTQRTDMTVHRIARLRPIVIDESLVDLESLRLARQRGYTGIALKACKGQTECLLMAAAGVHHQMFVCVQDLTCIGGSFLHSAAIASRLPAVVAIEGNGRQYCPAGNEAYMAGYAPMFRVRYGTIPTQLLDGIGLGFEWQPLGSDN